MLCQPAGQALIALGPEIALREPVAVGERGDLVGPDRVGVVADLVRLGLVERQGTRYLVPSPAMLWYA